MAKHLWSISLLILFSLLFGIYPVPLSLAPNVGNGYVGTVVGSNSTYIAGVYNGYLNIAPSHRARIPATNSFTLYDRSANAHTWQTQGFLNTFAGLFMNTSVVENSEGYQVAYVTQGWYAHRVLKNVMVYYLDIQTLDDSLVLEFELNQGGASADIAFASAPSGCPSGTVCIYGTINTPEVTYFSLFDPVYRGGPKIGVAVVATRAPTILTLGPRSNYSAAHISAFATSLETSTPLSLAANAYVSASSATSSLLATHIESWWLLMNSTIMVGYDDNLQSAIDSSFYYLYSAVREGWEWGFATSGIALGNEQQNYNGHVFWDAEFYMLPPLMLVNPEMANTQFLYRLKVQPGAVEKAKSYNSGYQGSMFPWESAFSGEEVCPISALTGLYEQHITGDIAIALRSYWWHTQNMTWLSKVAFPLISGIAQFWASRVQRQPDGSYSINHVIPVDERLGNTVNNSINSFTNVGAKVSFDFYNEAAALLNLPTNQTYAQISQGLVLPFDPVNQRHLSWENYYSYNESAGGTEVLMLGYPIQLPMSTTVRRNDIAYYNVSRCEAPGAPYSMVYPILSIAQFEIGNKQTGEAYFNQSYVNMHPPYNVMWELVPSLAGGGCHNFLTGYGGFLQGILNGWGGLRVNSSGFFLNPTLPSWLDFIAYQQVHFLGATFTIGYTAYNSSVLLLTPSAMTTLYISDSTGQEHVMQVGQELVLPPGCLHIYSEAQRKVKYVQ